MGDKEILVVDDDPKIRSLIRSCLEVDGWGITEAGCASEVKTLLAKQSYDLVTLDINLGHDDGFDVARTIRKTSQVPIIMLTGKDDVIDKVVGLEIGADDYIVKPFHVRELVARVKSVLRRAEGGKAPVPATTPSISATSKIYRFDGLTAIPDRFELRDRAGQICDLTSGDFKLLSVFLDRPKRVLSRDQLMNLTGGIDWTPLDRTIDNQVARLRKKIERDPANPQLIKTVRGVGYSFSAEVKTDVP